MVWLPLFGKFKCLQQGLVLCLPIVSIWLLFSYILIMVWAGTQCMIDHHLYNSPGNARIYIIRVYTFLLKLFAKSVIKCVDPGSSSSVICVCANDSSIYWSTVILLLRDCQWHYNSHNSSVFSTHLFYINDNKKNGTTYNLNTISVYIASCIKKYVDDSLEKNKCSSVLKGKCKNDSLLCCLW